MADGGGLLGRLFGGQGGGGGILGGGLQRLLEPSVALPVAAAMMAAPTFGQSMAGGFAAAAPGISMSRKRQAINAWLKGGAPKDVQHPLTQELFAQAPEIAGQYIGHQFGVGVGADNGFGQTPLYFKDKDGNLKLGRFNGQGGVTMATPDGMSVADPITYLNTGGNFTPSGKRGGAEGAAVAGVAPVPIDTEAAARGAAVGKGQGEAIVSARSMKSKLPGLQTVIEDLGTLGDTATYTEGGKILDFARRQLNMEPRESAVARTKYMAMVDNQVLPLLRDTFGAAFTEREGASLRATLGAPDVSPQEKRAVLSTFIKQKVRDVTAMEQQAAGAAGAAPGLEIGGPPADLGSGITIERVE